VKTGNIDFFNGLLPDSYANREVYRIKQLEQDELIQAIAVEYGFIRLHEIDDA
jgi:hypothetical protein